MRSAFIVRMSNLASEEKKDLCDLISDSTITTTTPTSGRMLDSRSQSMNSGKAKRPQLFQMNKFHSVSIIVEPVLDDDHASEPLILTPTLEVKPPSESPLQPSPQSPVLDYDDFIYESQRKKSQEEEEIVQSIIANARLRKEEFARLLEEHAQLVNEINKAETTLL